MKNVFALFLGVAFCVVSSCSQRTQPQDTAAAVQAINAAANQEIAMFSSGNVDSVLLGFAPDAVLMPPNEAAVHGRDNLRIWAQGMYQQFSLSARYLNSDVTVVGDWAIQRYTYLLTLTPKAGGQSTEERGKGIHIFRRQPDGSWLIVQDIWNSDAPPVAPQQ
jgi:ketosteroid isomerase-like protein